MYFKKFLFALFVLFSSTSISYSVSAPDFQLQDLDGNYVKLSEQKGKVVFIDFWATWCPPCRASLPAVKQLNKLKAGNPNFIVLGINVGENRATIDKFIKEHDIDYKILLGENRVSVAYAVNGIPAFFIIDKSGEVVRRYAGYTKGLEKEWLETVDKLLK
ncbi:MAG: TlpA family protein disulfide reductase [Elusimicrobiota bacterium]|jgi:thiol-disulfide isomerase/thioredoxin|nr:TlpA family protein disulfide reductase [Elusimicrobiota bacterium]